MRRHSCSFPCVRLSKKNSLTLLLQQLITNYMPQLADGLFD